MKINSNKIVKVNNLTVKYAVNQKPVLKDFQLEIEKGNHLAIIGSSGCGKSTFAKTLVQMLPSRAICTGEININGKDPRLMKHKELQLFRRSSFGYIYQDAIKKLNPLMTIGQHLCELIRLNSLDKSQISIRKNMVEILDKVGIHSTRANAFPHEFSGGMRQRVCIAMALALRPPLLIADEPTSSLDCYSSYRIMDQLLSLCEECGSTLILISHDISLAKKWCSKLAILNNGLIEEQGEINTIFEKPNSKMGSKLVKAASSNLKKNTSYKLNNEILLEAYNLRHWYKLNSSIIKPIWNKALNEVSFKLFQNETLGIVGISGCGKSTLCRVLSGLIKVRGGYLRIKDSNFKNNERKTILDPKNIQMIFQDPFSSLNPIMTIRQILVDVCLINNIKSKNIIIKTIKRTLSNLNLPVDENFLNSYPKNLSGGQLQRISLARALLIQPKILICDESVNMLDAYVKIEILRLLREVQERMSLSIIFITHDLGIAKKFCDRILVMDSGQIVEVGTSKDIFNNPKHIATKRLINSCLNI